MTMAQRKAKARTTGLVGLSGQTVHKAVYWWPASILNGYRSTNIFWVTITSTLLSGRGRVVWAKSDPPCLSRTAFCGEYQFYFETALSTEGWEVSIKNQRASIAIILVYSVTAWQNFITELPLSAKNSSLRASLLDNQFLKERALVSSGGDKTFPFPRLFILILHL